MIIITNNKNDNNNGFIVIHTKYFVIFLLAQIPPTKSLHIQLVMTKFGRRYINNTVDSMVYRTSSLASRQYLFRLYKA